MSSTNMFIPSELQSMASSFFSAYASLAASTMLVRSVTNDLIPSPFRSYVESALRYLFTSRAPQFITIVVDEYAGYTSNQVYQSVEIYLRGRISSSTERFKVNKTPRQAKINTAIDREFEVMDGFQNFEVKWKFVIAEQQNRVHNYYELSFEKKFKEQVLDDYLPFVLAKSQELKEKNKFVKLYTKDIRSDDEDDYGHGRCSARWGSINLEHPFTFDSLAMDPDMKKAIIDDLERFVRRKDYYKKVGKAWKRGYLLYGPPGTGKSSIIAAMANYLKFDIYDLELTSMYSNSDLRRVLLSTTNRSIIVIEDIDCSAQTKNRESDDYQYYSRPGLTLSGLLNFIDGLWSSCADERIIIFTTNHKDRLDPALLRPGRMDMHIYMSYCTHHGFRVLASNYLGVKDHRLFGEIEKVIGKVQVTPAQLAEEMMKSEDVDVALQGVLDFLNHKEMELLAACNKAKEIDTIISLEEPTSGCRAPTAHVRGRGRGGRGRGGGGGRGRGGGGGAGRGSRRRR